MNATIFNPVIKDMVTFTNTAASTNGRISMLEVTLMPGGGTPMHYHRNFSETFIVTEGRADADDERPLPADRAGRAIHRGKRESASMSDMHPAGAAMLFIPLFKLLGWMAGMSGAGKRVEAKYCR